MPWREIDQAVADTLAEMATQGGYRAYTGSHVPRLCESLAERFGVAEVLLTSSGTAAVELALRAGGIGQGDEVLLSAYDYPGNFWAIERVGARPVLMDVEPEGWRLAADGPVDASACRAWIVSHLHGQLQEVERQRDRCDARGVLLIEDACQALGATLAGAGGIRSAGSVGHVGIVSFGGGKTVSAGRGGALLTSDPSLAQRARIAAGAGSGPYTMSEMQAAVVVAQLPWLDAVNERSRDYFSELCEHLATLGTISPVPFVPSMAHAAFYQAGFLLADDRSTGHGESSSDPSMVLSTAIGQLCDAGLPAGAGFPGFHRRSTRRCRAVGRLDHVGSVVRRTLTLHHRLAMEGRVSSRRAAELIAPWLAGVTE